MDTRGQALEGSDATGHELTNDRGGRRHGDERPCRDPDDRLPAFADAPVGLVLADHQGPDRGRQRRLAPHHRVLGGAPLDDHEAWALLHPEDRDEVRAAWAAACAGGDELEVRARMVTRDGDVRWTDTAPRPSATARPAPRLRRLGARPDPRPRRAGQPPGDGALAPDVADALPQGSWSTTRPAPSWRRTGPPTRSWASPTTTSSPSRCLVDLGPGRRRRRAAGAERAARRACLGEPVVVEVVGSRPGPLAGLDRGHGPSGRRGRPARRHGGRLRSPTSRPQAHRGRPARQRGPPPLALRVRPRGRLPLQPRGSPDVREPRWSELTGIGAPRSSASTPTSSSTPTTAGDPRRLGRHPPRAGATTGSSASLDADGARWVRAASASSATSSARRRARSGPSGT